MATIALIVDWCGPFATVDKATEAAKKHKLGEVLYLATGKRAYQRTASMQYVGISTNFESRVRNDHHKLTEITKNLGIWLGAISSQSIAGRRSSSDPVRHSLAAALAEWVIAYFLALPLNERLRVNPPKTPVIVISRWFKSDLETKWRKRGHRDWPDLIEFDPDYEFARLQWFGSPGKSKRFSASDIKGLVL